jgi:TRAP-type C4-dicarboxylate transport system permease small subunit
MTFIGASYAAKKRTHIRIDVIETFLEKKKAATMKLIAMLIFLIFTIIFFKIGTDICSTLLVRPQKSSVLGISMIYVYAALPTGMILTSLRLIQSLWREYGYKKNKEGGAL